MEEAIAVFTGLSFHYTPLLTGRPGVDYYAEAHRSPWNATIHAVGMPFTAYGGLIVAGHLLRSSVGSGSAPVAQQRVFLAYMAHYAAIDPLVAFCVFAIYGPVLMLARRDWQHLVWGICVMATALFLQEALGHYIGGDMPSRGEGVLNAVVYAVFFAAEHLLLLFG